MVLLSLCSRPVPPEESKQGILLAGPLFENCTSGDVTLLVFSLAFEIPNHRPSLCALLPQRSQLHFPASPGFLQILSYKLHTVNSKEAKSKLVLWLTLMTWAPPLNFSGLSSPSLSSCPHSPFGLWKINAELRKRHLSWEGCFIVHPGYETTSRR